MAPTAKSGSATHRTRRHQPRLFSILVLGVLLSGCTKAPAAEITHDFFEQYDIVTGTTKRQTVLPGFFLGGATAELVVVHVDDNNDRRLQMYGFDGTDWVSVLEATLRPDVVFVDVASIGDRDCLITYQGGRLNWFDPDSATERVLAEIAINYNATDDGEIPRVDIARDVNRDGRDDLLVPDVDGFWISIQLSDGSFTDAVKLGPPEPFRDEAGVKDSGIDVSRTYGEVGITRLTFPWYLSRVHEMDYDQDSRSDLVFWNEDHFDVYHQDAHGQFDPVAKTFTTDVPFDSDGIYTRMFEFSDESAFSFLFGFNENTRRTVLHSFRDLNRDGVADLVTLTLVGRSILRQSSLYEVHFGTATPEGATFARDAGTAIQPRGTAGGMQPWGYSSQSWQDFDGDGLVDIKFGDVNIGLGGMTRALLANSVSMDLEFYRSEDGLYPDKPTTTRKIRPDLSPFKGRKAIFFPEALMGDVNGDGRSDLLVGKSREELHVFIGVPGPDLLARQPQKVAVALPADQARNIWLVDLNKDGKLDLLMHHPGTSEPQRLTMLVAR